MLPTRVPFILFAIALAAPLSAHGVTLFSTNGIFWNVDEDDHGEVTNGSPDTFDSFPNMCLSTSLSTSATCAGSGEEYETNTWAGVTEEGGQEIVMDTLALGGLTAQRKIYSPSTGSETFLRYMEVFTNATSSPITVDVRVGSTTEGADLGCRNTAIPTSCVINASASGDTTASNDEYWWVIDDSLSPAGNNGGVTDNAVGFVVGQAGGSQTSWTVNAIDAYGNGDTGDSFVQFENVTIPANSTRIILWFLVQRVTSADAAADAAVLAELNVASEALTGMSATEQSQVLNWGMSQATNNAAPVADPSGPYTGSEGTGVQMTDGSVDSDGAIVAWLWDFGDGTTSTAQSPSHTYEDEGTFTVNLTVTDDLGAIGAATTTATIANVAPTVGVTIPATGTTGDDLSFSGSFSDPGSFDSHALLWDFGDSTTNANTLTPMHSYSVPGAYTVTLTVTDNDGGIGAATGTVVVSDPSGDDDDSTGSNTCSAEGFLSCGDTVSVDTNDGSNEIETYSCEEGWLEDGPELSWTLPIAQAGEVTLTLTGAAAQQDFDIFVLPDDGSGCDPDACLAFGDVEVSFDALADETYWIVIDGYEGSVGAVEFEVTCSGGGDDDDATRDDDDATGDDDDSTGDDDDSAGGDDDDDGDDDDAGRGGCGCAGNVSGAGAGGGWLLLLVGLAGALRRRRAVQSSQPPSSSQRGSLSGR